MWLLDVKTYELVEIIGQDIPPYAILSHTWGKQEVTFKDFETQEWLERNDKSEGRHKILGCCTAAFADDFNFVWIDTCCIDKSSSAELSEAINSMFQWYRKAAICYAYLSDVDNYQDPAEAGSDFTKSKWFKRGWTLQELLAPTEVVFFGSDWVEIGTKRTLQNIITTTTRISSQALMENQTFSMYSIAQRMSWAADRHTSRLEDEAYCLMGLFDVNMPLLYGEGKKAFARLQEEIMKRTDDESIFAWTQPVRWPHLRSLTGPLGRRLQLSGLLAESPRYFDRCSKVAVLSDKGSGSFLRQARSVRGYRNAFELVRQLFRVRTPVFGPLKAMAVEHPGDEFYLRSVSDVIFTGDSRRHGDESSGWQWFPNNVVIVVPLMCAVDERPLGILLSNIAIGSQEQNLLHRLHSPSLICIDNFFEGGNRVMNEAASADYYVYLSHQYPTLYSPPPKNFTIRSAQVLQKGYITGRQLLNCTFNREQSMISVSPSETGKMLTIFQHLPRAWTQHLPDFFVLTDFQDVIIGILHGSEPSLFCHEALQIDLSRGSSVAVPLGRGNEFIHLRKRILATSQYLHLSVETYGTHPRGLPVYPIMNVIGTLRIDSQIFTEYLTPVTGTAQSNRFESKSEVAPQDMMIGEGEFFT